MPMTVVHMAVPIYASICVKASQQVCLDTQRALGLNIDNCVAQQPSLL